MSVEEVRSQIDDMLTAIRTHGCIPTMRSALLVWQQYLDEAQPNGLSVSDKKDYDDERKRVAFLLTDAFPDEEVVND